MPSSCELIAHRGLKSAISLVAFYADCSHEVRPVKSGHRITLTYNLLFKGDATPPASADERPVLEPGAVSR